MRTVTTLLIVLAWPAAAAVALAWGAHDGKVSAPGLTLLAICTGGAYALDRLRDGDAEHAAVWLWGVLHWIAIASAIIVIHEPWRFIYVLFLAGLALAYVPLKRIIPKNVVAASAWTIAVIVLPRTEPPPFDGTLLVSAFAVAMVMFANTTLSDVRTIDEDRARGIRSVSVCYGERIARLSALAAALMGLGFAIIDARIGLAACALGHAMTAWPVRNPRRVADAFLLIAWVK